MGAALNVGEGVREKTVNPTWNIPESIRKERIADRGYSEVMIPGGDPKNPLGKYRMRLTLDLYGIHGTNIPWGVGMLVSHGCVRLDQPFVAGLHRVEKTWVYVSAGTGYWGPPMCVGSTAELTRIELVAA